MRTVTVLLSVCLLASTAHADRPKICDDAEARNATMAFLATVTTAAPTDFRTIKVNPREWGTIRIDEKKMIARMVRDCFSENKAVDFVNGFTGKRIGYSSPFTTYAED